jgi:fructose-1,6-bisphosphatase/inositol monophosphatase family enzyme
MDHLLRTALLAAHAASRVHLQHFGSVNVEGAQEKASSDFVSLVDLEAQEAALGVIRRRHPHHRILAEEEDGSASQGAEGEGEGWESRQKEYDSGSGDDGGSGGDGRSGDDSGNGSGSRAGDDSGNGSRSRVGDGSRQAQTPWPRDGTPLWIVDPLDGTTNYLHRHPQFAASVAVGRSAGPDESGSFQGGVMEAGAVMAARTGESWWARRGRGAWKNGLPLSVSGATRMATALVGTGFPFKAPHLLDRYSRQFQRILPACGGVRRCGSAALDLCFLAEGVLDAFWEEDYLSPWDVAAGVLILEEAGGMATRLDGGPLTLDAGSVLGANGPGLHEALGRLVRNDDRARRGDSGPGPDLRG